MLVILELLSSALNMNNAVILVPTSFYWDHRLYIKMGNKSSIPPTVQK